MHARSGSGSTGADSSGGGGGGGGLSVLLVAGELDVRGDKLVVRALGDDGRDRATCVDILVVETGRVQRDVLLAKRGVENEDGVDLVQELEVRVEADETRLVLEDALDALLPQVLANTLEKKTKKGI
mgnify:CR=1 FL=1